MCRPGSEDPNRHERKLFFVSGPTSIEHCITIWKQNQVVTKVFTSTHYLFADYIKRPHHFPSIKLSFFDPDAAAKRFLASFLSMWPDRPH